MSAWSVGGWAGWVSGRLTVVFVVCRFGVGGFATFWNWFLRVYGGWNTFDIFLCNIVQCVLCACLSGLKESQPIG